MAPPRPPRLAWLAVLAAAVALAACGETQPSRFYVLSAAPPADAASPPTTRRGVLAVGPIDMPKYLDRAQIVTLTEPNQLAIAEFDRWAEPLANNFARAMAENLSQMAAAARVEIYPFPTNSRDPATRQIAVQVIQFHPRADGVVELWANWSILDQDGRRVLASGTSKASETAAIGDYQSVAAAMSRAIATFSRYVATAYNALPPPSGT